jgi:hypothetical protein
MGVGDQLHAPATLPSGKTPYTMYRGLGEPQGLSGRVLKISSLPRLDPRTVQPVASRVRTGDKLKNITIRLDNISVSATERAEKSQFHITADSQ